MHWGTLLEVSKQLNKQIINNWADLGLIFSEKFVSSDHLVKKNKHFFWLQKKKKFATSTQLSFFNPQKMIQHRHPKDKHIASKKTLHPRHLT